MNLKRFVVEMGTGVDQHGQDVTKAAVRAVKDAISRVCLSGLREILRVSSADDMLVEVLVACPNSKEVRTEEVLDALPFGRKQIKVVEGGMSARVTFEPQLGDKTDHAMVANAAITVSVDMDKVLETWKRGS
jgi:uncharacterized protein (TIGR02058 family)